jgi:hypothetical protein
MLRWDADNRRSHDSRRPQRNPARTSATGATPGSTSIRSRRQNRMHHLVASEADRLVEETHRRMLTRSRSAHSRAQHDLSPTNARTSLPSGPLSSVATRPRPRREAAPRRTWAVGFESSHRLRSASGREATWWQDRTAVDRLPLIRRQARRAGAGSWRGRTTPARRSGGLPRTRTGRRRGHCPVGRSPESRSTRPGGCR